MRATDLLFLTLVAAACGKPKPATPANADTPSSGATADTPSAGQAQAEAAELGREIFDLVDRTMNYRSAHYGEFPANLPTMGIDSLTHLTVRRLSVQNQVPTVTAAFRHTEGHAVTQCVGTNKVLEDSMLNGGPYSVLCTLTDGTSQNFTVGG